MTDQPLTADFLIGGAPRSGTTALADTLDRHPRIAVARPLVPEPKVFMTPADGPEAYRERYRAFFRNGHEGLVRGEKTSYYLESDEACERVRATLPGVRVLFVFREPVERAYSNWAWTRKNGLETLPFAEAIEVEGRRENPLPEERAYARPFDYLSRGGYATFARRWIDALGRERVAMFLYEDLLTERRPLVLREIQEFLGVEPRELGELPAGLENETRGSVPELDASLRAELRERMRPLVEDFAALSGLDVAGSWGYR